MSNPDATPSRDGVIAIPEHLLGLLRDTAERNLERACDQAFAPDMIDAVVDAVHVLDAFAGGTLPRETALALIPGAIEFEEPGRLPHTVVAIEEIENHLNVVRELIALRDRLGGSPPS
jgi:hypothetical protein